jgi:hypothetical protein
MAEGIRKTVRMPATGHPRAGHAGDRARGRMHACAQARTYRATHTQKLTHKNTQVLAAGDESSGHPVPPVEVVVTYTGLGFRVYG